MRMHEHSRGVASVWQRQWGIQGGAPDDPPPPTAQSFLNFSQAGIAQSVEHLPDLTL